MAKKDVIEAEGKVIEAQPNAMFIVELETCLLYTSEEAAALLAGLGLPFEK